MENADLRETKQIIYYSKGIDESYPKNVLLIEFEPLCQKLWAFMSNFRISYDARSPNMAMSRDPRSKFRKQIDFPNSAFNIKKSYKISRRKALYFRSYRPKNLTRWDGKHLSLVLLGLRLSLLCTEPYDFSVE